MLKLLILFLMLIPVVEEISKRLKHIPNCIYLIVVRITEHIMSFSGKEDAISRKPNSKNVHYKT